MTLHDLQTNWQDTPEHHAHIHELFTELVNKDDVLNTHRTWVETNVWGFGARSFHYLWKLLLAEIPESPRILEVGCFRGQTLSLFKLLRPDADVYGVTPLDTSGGMWESDYRADIDRIHDAFVLERPTLLVGMSQNEDILNSARVLAPFNLIYIDGAHDYETAFMDLLNYGILIGRGGYLVIDDCNCEMHMPWGYFQGIDTVTSAKLKWLETDGDNWEFVCSCVHVSVYRRK